jgi:hypothetical protein
VKKALFLFFVVFATLLQSSQGSAQTPGGQDSTGTGVPALRPRRDTYIIVPYPSPARPGTSMNIQFYNHQIQEVSLSIVDVLGKTILELQAQQTMSNGIHSYPFQTNSVSPGTYYVRLVTYSSTGSQNQVQNEKFIVLH